MAKAKSAIPRREFLQLAKVFDPKAKKPALIAGWYVSEKLDGTRCFWDGGISRGMRTEDVPWASVIDPKTGKRKNKIKPIATGLWSRYGNPIVTAPDWFLDSLPSCPLDGELWAGRGNYQLNRSIVGGDDPDPRFDQIQYAVYGCPSMNLVIQTGEIKNTNFHLTLDLDKIARWVDKAIAKNCPNFVSLDEDATFTNELMALNDTLKGERVFLHKQTLLPNDEAQARAQVELLLTKAIDAGGEGLIIRNPSTIWTPKRVANLLKYKPFEDDEGTVVGFTSGRETDKGSKLLGMIGALILDYDGKRLELSGLTNEEREFLNQDMTRHAATNPGKDMPAFYQGKHFKVGDKVTFIYRELTDDGIPKEARYLRERDEE